MFARKFNQAQVAAMQITKGRNERHMVVSTVPFASQYTYFFCCTDGLQVGKSFGLIAMPIE